MAWRNLDVTRTKENIVLILKYNSKIKEQFISEIVQFLEIRREISIVYFPEHRFS